MAHAHSGSMGRLAAALLLCLAAAAGQPKAFTYRGGDQGPVVFDHQLHAKLGQICRDCHTAFPGTGRQLFQTRKQGRISLADHSGDGKCFACHDGKAASADCGQCHRI